MKYPPGNNNLRILSRKLINTFSDLYGILPNEKIVSNKVIVLEPVHILPFVILQYFKSTLCLSTSFRSMSLSRRVPPNAIIRLGFIEL